MLYLCFSALAGYLLVSPVADWIRGHRESSQRTVLRGVLTAFSLFYVLTLIDTHATPLFRAYLTGVVWCGVWHTFLGRAAPRTKP